MWKIFLCYSIYLIIILLINLDQFARHCFNSLNPPQAWFGYSGHLHFQTKTIWVTCPRSHSQYQRRCSFSGFTDNNHLQHSMSFLKQNFSVCVLSPIWLFAAAQTAACQAPLSTLQPVQKQAPLFLQARILEWVAISFSRRPSQTWGSNLHLLWLLHSRQVVYPLSHRGRCKTSPVSSPFECIYSFHAI